MVARAPAVLSRYSWDEIAASTIAGPSFRRLPGIHAVAEYLPGADDVSQRSSVSIALVAALVLTTPLRPPRGTWPLLIGVGVGDTLANVLVAVASTQGAIGIVAVLSATYPIVTVLLARLYLDERLTTAKRAGGATAISGAVLVAAG